MVQTSGGGRATLDAARALALRVCDNVEQVLVGKRAVVELSVAALLAEGHLLLEDVPGTGKTTLARALAVSIGGSFKRIQCTPDLLPSDITGVSVFDQRTGEFSFRPGPLFANVVLADEINRATPRTQSAVLEAMQEAQVSADGVTRSLPRPFLVLATQNPVELEGTFPLPEAQLDRFLMRLSVGYPAEEDEEAMAAQRADVSLDVPLEAVATPDDVLRAAGAVVDVRVHPDVRRYLVRLVRATRIAPDVRLGASPRATLALQRAAQAWAAIKGRDFVTPDDVQHVLEPVLVHRIVLRAEARLRGRDGAAVLAACLGDVAVPVEGRMA